MTIGIIGAMEIEVEEIRNMLEGRSEEEISGIKFYTGTLFGKRVVVAKCGIGKVFASVCAEAMILKYNPCLIVNTGVGGGLSDGLSTSDVAIATKLVQHDMDTSALGDEVGLVSGINKVFFETDERARQILLSSAAGLGINAKPGIIASGDKFIADRSEKKRITELFGACACEMEGAAIAQTAYINSTPFAVIRAISDSADDGATMDYGTFLPLAAKASKKLALALVEKY